MCLNVSKWFLFEGLKSYSTLLWSTFKEEHARKNLMQGYIPKQKHVKETKSVNDKKQEGPKLLLK